MFFKFIFLTSLAFILTFGENVFVQKQNDKIFECHVIMQLRLPSWPVCLHHCTLLSVCKSVNFIKSTSVCEINNASPDGSYTFLTDSPGDVFIDVSAVSQNLAGTCKHHDCTTEEICKTESTDYTCQPLHVPTITRANHYTVRLYEIITCQPLHFHAVTCNPGWDYYKGHCYYFGQNAVDWTQAQTYCTLMCSNLLKIENNSENLWIKTILTDRGFTSSFWIGATDQDKEDKWIWISDGLSLNYTNWAVFQPDNSRNENCVELKVEFAYYWNDGNCLGMNSYICEK